MLLALRSPTAISDDTTRAAARQWFLQGRYDEAAEQFGKDAEHDPAAVIGLARCRVATGKREQARRLLEAASERFEKSAAVRSELAQLALDRSDYDAAKSNAEAALARDKDCVAARWVTAELLRLSGRLAEAELAYRWFIDYYNRAPRIESAEVLVIIGRGAAEHTRWTRNSSQFHRLISEVLPTALARATNYWPAHLEAAQLYLEKFNDADAAAQIGKGLAINPNAAELHAARAELALNRFELAAAKRSIDRALEINSELLWAHRLKADWLLVDLHVGEAIDVLLKALELNPRDEATLGRLVAAYIAVKPPGKRSAQAEQLLAEAVKHNPHCGELYLAAADSFDRMRRFSLADEYLRLAHERMPQLIQTRGKLGLVLMRLGEESEAAKLLAESFAIDPFNVRVKNMLEVLDVLKDYATIETEHFVMRFDRGQDELLARYATRFLEDEAFPYLAKECGYAPQGKTLIEIFSHSGRTSGHSWFSARMVGLPFIGTVGACAGKIIALTSPSELPEKYDWSLVLRHELTHVFNLQQTDFAVPHWLTEGLAVHLENQPRPRKWNEVLVRRAKKGELFSLNTITLGFIRPQSSDDWTLAYCQAELYIDYIIEKYGSDAVSKLLAAYADRCSTAAALERCFGVKLADFEAGYRQYIDRIIEAVREMVPQTKQPLAELQRRAETVPDDADAAAKLALAWLERGDKPLARRWASTAKRLNPQQPGAAYVLARLQLESGDEKDAISMLEAALDKNAPHEELLALLAALELKAGELATAEDLYRLGDERFSGSDRWVKGLASVYLRADNKAKLVPVLHRWSELEPDNAAVQKKLAQLAQAAGDFVAAAEAATRAVRLDVQDAASHALLAAALAGQHKPTAAIDEYEVVIRLDSNAVDAYAGLAKLQIELGRKDDARLVVGRLREIAPNHPQLRELEKSLQP
jgi:tetratricopeptide (TPR) repeat protein